MKNQWFLLVFEEVLGRALGSKSADRIHYEAFWGVQEANV